MKTISILFIVLLSASWLYAQRPLKYKDVHETVLTGEREEAYAQLLAYQKQDPDFANTYFQLGLIADYWARLYDPLTEYNYVKSFIYDTKLYFGLAQLKLKDERGRNRNLYQNGSKAFEENRPEIKEIEDFVNTQIKNIEEYEKKITEIVEYFNLSSDSYNACLDIFKQINEDYSQLKNIWMSNEPKLLSQLDELKNKFDTTLWAFDNYKTALAQFPLGNYNQRYSLKQIYTYRLHGLTPSNFLNRNIELWDFNSWVEQIHIIHNSSIDDTRKKIVNEQMLSEAVINTLSKEVYSDQLQEYALDQNLIYQIEKYDYQSVITSLFRTREAYANFLHHFRKTINAPNAKGYALRQSSNYYHQLIIKKINFYEKMQELQSDIIPEKTTKHSEFIQKYYQSLQGMKNYADALEQNIVKFTNTALERYRKFIDNELERSFPEALKHRNENIYYPGENYQKENLNSGSYYVIDFKYDTNNNCYFTGFYKSRDNKYNPFYAKTDSVKNINFFQNLNQAEFNDYAGKFINIFENGAIITLSKHQEDDSYQHFIIKTDKEGKEISKNVLPFTKQITKVVYDDINELADFTMQETDNQIHYAKYELSKNTVLLNKNLEVWGEVFGVLRFEQNNLIFVNYSRARNIQSGFESAQPASHQNPRDMALVITDDIGNIIDKKFYKFNENIHGRLSIKINSNTANITAVEKDRIGNIKEGAGVYIIIDGEGNIIWQNRHN